jgi:hypothetical protein
LNYRFPPAREFGGAAHGLICCSGTGLRGDGFRYWLPGREPLLWPGDKASEAEKNAWRARLAAHTRSLREQPLL